MIQFFDGELDSSKHIIYYYVQKSRYVNEYGSPLFTVEQNELIELTEKL